MSDSVDVDKPQSSMSAEEKKRQLNERFRKLAQKRQETQKLNKADVVEEDRKIKNPKVASQEARKEWELKELEEKKKAEEEGIDYDRLKALNTPADVAWKINARKRRNPNANALVTGDYEAMSLRQNERLTKQLKPDFEEYKKMKQVVGSDQFFPSANTLMDDTYYPTDGALNKLQQATHDMIKTREKVHRRRMFDPDSEVTYINEKNRVFNNKLEKYYGKYTEDLREDLERGTAL